MGIENSGEVLRQLRHLFGSGSAAGLSDRDLLARFVERGDRSAFEILAMRHGPMVLGVCRRAFGRSPDADDAFQAVFLILARRARQLRAGHSIGPWLHGVARKVTIRARSDRFRRLDRERPTADLPPTPSQEPDPDRDELRAILDEELARLPERYRATIVLCHLEGLSHEQAAQQLGCPTSTVGVRLMRGRNLLRDRLTRRGISAPAGLLAGLLADEAKAHVPGALLDAASRVATASTAAGPVTLPASVLSLAEGAITTMIHLKLARALAVFTLGSTLLGVASVGAIAWTHPGPPPPAGAVVEVPDDENEGSVPVSGLVVDERGEPAEGVTIFASSREGIGWGQVVARGTSDADGQFRFDVPERSRPGSVDFNALWAFEPGKLVASIEGGLQELPRGLPARLALGPPAEGTRFEIRGPDGRPVPGATIMPRVLTRNHASVPDGLVDLIAEETVTDSDGRATMTAFLPEELSTVIVTAEGFGSQQFGFGHSDISPEVKVIRLFPAGRLVGRIEGPPEIVSGVLLQIGTNNPTQVSPWPSLVFRSTDAEGRFEIPALAEGTLFLSPAASDAASPFILEQPPKLTVSAGETTEVTLKMSRGIEISGRIMNQETEEPIEGATLYYNPRAVGAPLLSDAEGRYRGYGLPGRFFWRAFAPRGFADLKDSDPTSIESPPSLEIPDGVDRFELPIISLVPSHDLRGLVVDPSGEPVPGAEVTASWRRDPQQPLSAISRTLWTDPEGTFLVDQIPKGRDVRLEARTTGQRTPEPIEIPADADEPVRLTLSPLETVAMQGRVIDERGNPLPGALVHLRSLTRYDSGQRGGDALVRFDGQAVLFADDEGRFTTPPQLDPSSEYAAYAQASGFQAARTAWTAAASERFPDLVLKAEARLSVVSGRILDTEGTPISDARVLVGDLGPARGLESSTDADGRFQLDGVSGSPAFLFASADGFRFGGLALTNASDPESVLLTLAPIDQPPPPESALITLPPVLSRDEERLLALRILSPALERALETPDDAPRLSRLTSALPLIDSGQIQSLQDAGTIPEPIAELLRSKARSRVVSRDDDDPIARIEAIPNDWLQVRSLIDLADQALESDREEAIAWLDRAEDVARDLDPPNQKVRTLVLIVDQLRKLGLDDRANLLLRELEPIARDLPGNGQDGSARGTFAERLALLDLDAALALAEGITDSRGEPTARHQIGIARNLASQDPAATFALIDRIAQSDRRGDLDDLSRTLPRIAFSLSPDPRARRLPELARSLEMGRFDPALTLGMIALAQAEDDPDAAESLLRQAFDDLDQIAPTGRTGIGLQSAAIVGATLLHVAERIDPRLVPEFLWRALSFRFGNPRLDRAFERNEFDAGLALMLARYDREIAEAILSPLVSDLADLMTSGLSPKILLEALASIDPSRAAEVVDSLPDPAALAPDPFRKGPDDARIALAEWLSSDPESRRALALWDIIGQPGLLWDGVD